jgi:glycosyltransferase involved in cell wall biosynthesis
MRKRTLFYMSDARYGGWPTFLMHLAKAYRICGYQVEILCVRKTTERKLREFSNIPGLQYRNVSLQDALKIPDVSESLITCVHAPSYTEEGCALIAAGCRFVIHDPMQFRRNPEIMAILKSQQNPVWAIREGNSQTLRSHGINAQFIPHPYVPSRIAPVAGRKCAAAISRLDYDKLTHIIVQANRALPPEYAVDIYGDKSGRIYVYHVLDKDYPDWVKWYKGAFKQGTAPAIAGHYRMIVDMSQIVGDGGGSQYTFLEAWNAGCGLILNSKWNTGGEMQEGENCVFVSDSGELAEVLKSGVPEKIVSGGQACLRLHSPDRVIEELERKIMR